MLLVPLEPGPVEFQKISAPRGRRGGGAKKIGERERKENVGKSWNFFPSKRSFVAIAGGERKKRREGGREIESDKDRVSECC